MSAPESDTPETDQFGQDLTAHKVPKARAWPHWYDFARKRESERDQATAEIEKMRQQHADYLAGKATLTDICIGNGSMTVEVATDLAQVLASQFAMLLRESGGPNYMEMHLARYDVPGEALVLTLRWEAGKTPHELRQNAERERDQAITSLKAVRASIAEAEEYLGHTPICMKRGLSHAECDCGFDEVANRFPWTQEEQEKEGA